MCGELIDYYEARGARVIVLSEYGITPVVAAGAPQPRAARAPGCSRCARSSAARCSTPARSEAFAVADHQVAHVYVQRPDARSPRSARCSRASPGVERGARRGGQARRRARPRRARASWSRSPSRTPGSPTTTGSTTPRAPDFARTVDIHRKPGYDPVELFLDPAIRLPQLAIGWRLAQQEARLPHADGRDPARRHAGARARTAGSPTIRRRARC